MRILFLTQTFPRFAGDTSGPFIRDIARGLRRGGDEVSILAPHAPGVAASWVDDGVPVTTFRYAPERFEVLGYSRSLAADETARLGAAAVTPLYLAAAQRAVRRALQRERFDLVHAHWVVPNGPPAAFAVGRTPLAIGLHGSDVFMAEKPGVRRLVGWVLRRTALLTGCSPELVDRVRALGLPHDLARVIPYGVDVGVFAPGTAGRLSWRSRLGIPGEARVLLSVGRMATKKGFQVLLPVLPELLARHPLLHVVLAGGGDRLEEFRSQAAGFAPGLGERVHFPGAVGHDDLPDLFRAADLFVLPAVHDRVGNVDGLPNVILEAMASGLPVVASAISGIPLAVEPERTGLLVAENDGPGLAAALERLLAGPEWAKELGEAGRRKTSRELTWDAVAAAYRAAYVAALAR
ncbi:MAG: glycosyltransferase [Holophagales bacterium]|nr:MAG: glycosyltransferase [Holophagales bacterium]